MRKWLSIPLVFLVWGSFVLTACDNPNLTPLKSTTTPVKTIELKLNTMGPSTHRPSHLSEMYAAGEIEKRTNGRVKITIYNNSELAKPEDDYDATVKGICDISEGVAAYHPGKFPASEAVDLPLGWTSSFIASHAVTDFYNKFRPKEYNEVVVLLVYAQPPAVIGTVNKPVRTLESLKGLELRSTGGRIPSFIQSLGAIPRMMPLSDSYKALSKSIVDGIIVPIESYPSFKLTELINYVTDIKFVSYTNLSYWVMNKNSWNKIAPEDQNIILDVANETMEMFGKTYDDETKSAKKEFLSNAGKEYIELSSSEQAKFNAVVQGVIDQYIKERTADGYPATDYIKYLQERIAYWSNK